MNEPTAPADPPGRRPGVEFYTDEAGQHRFRIRASNGEIIHGSEAYTRAADAERAAATLRFTLAQVRLPGDPEAVD